MSELKVNTISPIAPATGIKINSPIGVNTNPPASGMQISGKLNVIDNNLEVVTVAGSNYGIKIKAPATNANSVLQFSNYDGTERATISSNSSNDLIFKAGGATAAVMSGGGVFQIQQQAQFNKPTTFKGITQFNNNTTFSSTAIPTCSGVPYRDEHLVNLAYLKRYVLNDTTVKTWSVFGDVNNAGFQGCCTHYKGVGNINGVNSNTAIGCYAEQQSGSWLIVGFSYGQRGCSCYDNEQFHFPIDKSKVWIISGDYAQTVQNTIIANLGSAYNAFGIAIRIV